MTPAKRCKNNRKNWKKSVFDSEMSLYAKRRENKKGVRCSWYREHDYMVRDERAVHGSVKTARRYEASMPLVIAFIQMSTMRLCCCSANLFIVIVLFKFWAWIQAFFRYNFFQLLVRFPNIECATGLDWPKHSSPRSISISALLVKFYTGLTH